MAPCLLCMVCMNSWAKTMIVASLVTTGCGNLATLGSETSSDDSDAVSGSTSSQVNLGSITYLDGNYANSEITFDNLSDGENVVIALYSFDPDNNSTGFGITGSESQTSVSAYLASSSDEEDENGDDEVDMTEEFHKYLIEDAMDLDSNAKLENLTRSSSQYLTAHLSAGSQREFNVLNSYASTESYDTVTATLRLETDEFEFYVDNRNADSIDDEDLVELADGFMTSEVNSLYGEESDVNGDGKFAVLFTQTVNSMAHSNTSMVTGFFLAKDVFNASTYPSSNEMEIFYTVVPDEDGDFGPALSKEFALSNILPSVLPHEYQHMISFNWHYFINDGSAEESWLNEGLSHLAEDIASLDSSNYMTETGEENPSRVAYYLNNINNTCFSCSSSLNARGGSYLFLRYIYEQAKLGNIAGVDHESLIENLLNTDERGVDNLIHTVFGSEGTEEDLGALMGQFALAIYLSNSGVDDSHYNFDGINLRATADDGRNTELDGPAIQTVDSLSFTDTLQGLSVSYVQVSGATINANGGTLNFSFSNNNMGGFIIRE